MTKKEISAAIKRTREALADMQRLHNAVDIYGFSGGEAMDFTKAIHRHLVALSALEAMLDK